MAKCRGKSFTGSVHATFYPGRPSLRPKYEGCRMLTVPTTPVFSYYTDPVLHHQSGIGLAWATAVI